MDKLVNTIIPGDALAILRTLPDNLVQTCITSPPYYGLRDYQTATWEGGSSECDHVAARLRSRFMRGKVSDKQLSNHGSDGDEGQYAQVCPTCNAVKIDQQIGLESSPDAYVARLVEVFREVRRVLRNDGTLWLNLGDSYSGSGKGGQSEEKRSENWQPIYANKGATYPGLGAKQLLGIPWRVAFALQTDGWILRSDIIWSKSNCMPESVEDRPTKSHEYLFLLSKSEWYYYDADAIREPLAYPDRTYGPTESHKTLELTKQGNRTTGGLHDGRTTYTNPLGRNKRTVWIVASQPFSEAHFATFPPKLIEPCILAGSQPGDIVLDCFMGAGTTALVAIQHSRHYLGIELNEAYVTLAEKRIQHVQQHLWTGEGIA